MNIKCIMVCFLAGFVPAIAFGQNGIADEVKSLQEVLHSLYDEMLPLCKSLIDVGRGIAGFAATWYIGYRVWGHIARAEPIDFYPLLRPFALGLAILNFELVIQTIRFVMEPTVDGTSKMVENSNKAVVQLLKMKEDAIRQTDQWKMYVGPGGSGDYDKWYKYNFPNNDQNWLQNIWNRVSFSAEKIYYNFRNSIKEWLSIVLQILFEAAALCINTIRTFYLIVFAIIGPLVLALSVFDGFQSSLRYWFARYINVYLWLPVANIFSAVIGKIQENMLKIDIGQIYKDGDTYFSATDAGYMVFMVIGIAGYFTIPSVANFIVQVGASGPNALGSSSIALTQSMSSTVVNTAQTVRNEGQYWANKLRNK